MKRPHAPARSTTAIATGLLAALALTGVLPLRANQAAVRHFDRVQLLETEGATSASVSMGDLDRDGDLDLVLAKGRHWPLHNLVLRNDGQAHFATEQLADSADRTYSAALADLDGDGDLDMVVSNDRPDRKLVYFNDGRGHYSAGGSFGLPEWSTRYVTVADVNGDKRPDVLVANRSANPANPRPSFVCLNDTHGAFPSCQPLATESATIIVAVDLDADGRVDLFVPHRDGGQSRVFWNDGSGTFSAPPTPIGSKASNVRAANAVDLDGDGRVDLVVGDEEAGLFVYRSSAHRQFGDAVAIGTPSDVPYSIGVADMDRDGRPDLVVGNDESPGAVLFNRGGAVPRFESVRWNDGKGAVYGVAIGDLDGDGWPDIAAARSGAPNGIWFSGAAARR